MKKKNIIIHIIGGTGKMGQWFKFFLEAQKVSVTIVDRHYLNKIELIKQADIVLVAVPISRTFEVIQSIIPFVSKNQLLTDITSVKTITLKAMEKALCATLGMHPLFGPSIGSVVGQKIVFCRQKDNELVYFLKTLFEHAGLEVVEMSGKEHDFQMAYIQALTHAIHLLFAKTILGQQKTILTKLQTPTFTLQILTMGRILNQDIQLVADIQMYNPYFLPVLTSFIIDASKLASILKEKDNSKFKALFSEVQNTSRNFSGLSLLQTNRILELISQIPKILTKKTKPIDTSENIRIGYLGPEGTYSHQATLQIFPKKNAQKLAYENLFEVFQAISEDEIDIGIVPAENSTEGTVRSTMDYLVEFSLYVIGSLEIPIHHQLLSNAAKLTEIYKIYSHPQALAQCKNWIKKHLPQATIIPTQSTTTFLNKLTKKEACVSSFSAHKLHKIGILAKNIEDEPTNSTRFYVISKNSTPLKQLSNAKTLLFLTVYNRVGILRDILNVFATHNLNLTKLESRPSREKIWDYHFFIEVDASQYSKSLTKALHGIETYCPVIRILGQT